MAYVPIPKVVDLTIQTHSEERRYDSTGELAVHPKVAAMYEQMGYITAPKTQEEKKRTGSKLLDGMSSSIVGLTPTAVLAGTNVSIHLHPTRYLLSQAVKDVVKAEKLTPQQAEEITVNLANVSLITPIIYQGRLCYLSQVKGPGTVGEGELQGAVSAGGVRGKELSAPNPFIEALRNQTSQEVGLALQKLSSQPFFAMVAEPELGNLNFPATSSEVSLYSLLEAYERMTIEKFAAGEPLEVAGIAIIPLENVVLKEAPEGKRMIEQVTVWTPSATGLKVSIEDRVLRPLGVALLEHFQDRNNLDFLVQRSGL